MYTYTRMHLTIHIDTRIDVYVCIGFLFSKTILWAPSFHSPFKYTASTLHIIGFTYVHLYIDYTYIYVYMYVLSLFLDKRFERWGAGVETQKNVLGVFGGWGRVPFNEPYAPSLSTIYDGA